MSLKPTVPASPSPEALALAARLSTIRTNAAAMAVALGKDK